MIATKSNFSCKIRTILFCAAIAISSPSWATTAAPTAIGAQSAGGITANQALRLQTIGYRLAVSNSSQCDEPYMQTGLTIHDLGRYDASERADVTSLYGLRSGFGVMHVVRGSAADAAGLMEGDEITSINGTTLVNFGLQFISKKGSFDRTASFLELLNNALKSGSVAVDFARRGSHMQIRLAGQPGCGGQVTLAQGGKLNAWSDGKYVALTSAMVDFASDDDELAFIVAHEMSHNILEHAKRLHGHSLLLAEFGLGAKRVKQFEIQADQLAIVLMANGGFNLDGSERLLARLKDYDFLNFGTTHPKIARRMTIVSSAISRARNEPDSHQTIIATVDPELSPSKYHTPRP